MNSEDLQLDPAPPTLWPPNHFGNSRKTSPESTPHCCKKRGFFTVFLHVFTCFSRFLPVFSRFLAVFFPQNPTFEKHLSPPNLSTCQAPDGAALRWTPQRLRLVFFGFEVLRDVVYLLFVFDLFVFFFDFLIFSCCFCFFFGWFCFNHVFFLVAHFAKSCFGHFVIRPCFVFVLGR